MRRLLLIGLLWTSLPVLAQDTPASPSMMTIGPIDSESDQKTTIITIRFDVKPSFDKPKIEAHGSFIQVLFPQTMVMKPGQYIEANSPYIRKYAVFQLDEQTTGLRLFVTKDAAQLLPAVKADILENRVVVMIDHVEAEKQLLAHFDGVPVAGGPSSEEIVKKTPVRSDIPDPIAIQATTTPLANITGAAKDQPVVKQTLNWDDNLQNKLIMATVFSAVMILLLLGIKTWRRLMSKKWPLAPSESFSMKTLASHAVGPKQKITVVQVGEEQILLGISPDGINFLSSLKKPEQAAQVQFDNNMRQKSTLLTSPALRPDSSSKKARLPTETNLRTAERPRSLSRDDLPEPGSSLSYSVGEQGIRNMKEANPTRNKDENNSIDDVTRLIRKKLRDLPKV